MPGAFETGLRRPLIGLGFRSMSRSRSGAHNCGYVQLWVVRLRQGEPRRYSTSWGGPDGDVRFCGKTRLEASRRTGQSEINMNLRRRRRDWRRFRRSAGPRLLRVLTLVGFAGFAVVFLAGTGRADTVTIDFESLPDGSPTTQGLPLADQWWSSHGVRFADPGRAFVAECGPGDESPCPDAASGERAIIVGSAGEFERYPLRVEFRDLQRSVSLTVRLDRATFSPGFAAIEVFDAAGAVIASERVDQSDGQWHLLQAGDPASLPAIAAVKVTGGNIDFAANFLVFDDLSFEGETIAEPPPPDTTPPSVSLAYVDARDPSDRDFTYRVTARDDHQIVSITYQITNPSGITEGPFPLCGGGLVLSCDVGTVVELTPAVLLRSGNGAYEIAATACDPAGQCATGNLTVHLDAFLQPQVRVLGVEVNQAVQSRLTTVFGSGTITPASTSVPLLPGKDTVVRYYLATDGGNTLFSARLTYSGLNRDGTTFGGHVSPLQAPVTLGATSESDPRAALISMRADPTQTLNFVIPGERTTDAEFLDVNLSVIPRLSGEVQISFSDPVSLGLNIIKVGGGGTGSLGVDADTLIDTTLIDYLEVAFPVSQVEVLSRRNFRWGGEYIFEDDCGSLLFDVWWAFGGDDAPVQPGRPYPIITPTLGVANSLTSCGGIAYVETPDDRVGSTAITTLFGDVAAQEVAHTIGLLHAGNAHNEADDGGYVLWPYAHGSVGHDPGLGGNFGVIPVRDTSGDISGFWLIDPCPTTDAAQRIPQCSIDTAQMPHDFMSYGPIMSFPGSVAPGDPGPFGYGDTNWVSDGTYRQIYFAIRDHQLDQGVICGDLDLIEDIFADDPEACSADASTVANTLRQPAAVRAMTESGPSHAAAQSQSEAARVDAFLVAGVVEDDDGVLLGPLMRKMVPLSMTDPRTGDHLTIRLLDARGETLVTHPVAVRSSSHSADLLLFGAIPFVPGVAELQITDGEDVLSTVQASSNPPTVTLLDPLGGEIFASGDYAVRWEATDPDGDALSFLVQYSPDDGASWQGLGIVHPGQDPDVALAVAELIPGNRGLIRITASDGINTSVDVTETFISVGTTDPPAPGTPQLAALEDQPAEPDESLTTLWLLLLAAAIVLVAAAAIWTMFIRRRSTTR